ncbi:MAG: hypothetical protein AAF993_18215 [Pseudomonadota bacterium]
MNQLFPALLVLLLLTACSNKLAEIADEELADGRYECRTAQDQSPGMAIRCDNIARECKRRRDEGRFVC